MKKTLLLFLTLLTGICNLIPDHNKKTNLTNQGLISKSYQFNNTTNNNLDINSNNDLILNKTNGIATNEKILSVQTLENGIIFVETQKHENNNYSEYFYYSTDGINFQITDIYPSEEHQLNFTIPPIQVICVNNIIYLNNQAAIWESKDKCKTWTIIYTSTASSYTPIYKILVSNNNYIYLEVEVQEPVGEANYEILYSSNNGDNWINANLGYYGDIDTMYCFAINPINNNLLVTGSFYNIYHGMHKYNYYSKNNGKFIQFNSSNSFNQVGFNNTFYSYQDSNDRKYYLYYSTDKAKSIKKINIIPGVDDHSISWDSKYYMNYNKKSIYFYNSKLGLYYSSDGINFIKINLGTNVKNIVFYQNYTYLLTNQGLYYSSDGVNFSQYSGLDNNISDITTDLQGNLLITDNGILYYANITTLGWIKSQIKFIYSNPNQTLNWLSENQVVTNKKITLEIANSSIDTITMNGGSPLPETDKEWSISVGDTKNLSDQDFNLNFNFTLNNKSYSANIIISSLLNYPGIEVTDYSSQASLQPYISNTINNSSTIKKINLTTSEVYYNNNAIKIKALQTTNSTKEKSITIYGLDNNWMKNSSPPVNLNINTNQVYTIDGSQLNAFQGRYMISVTDEGNNIQNYYLVINKNTQLAPNHFWNTNYGQWFLNFAKLNGYDSTLIQKMNNIQVNNLIVESSSWTKKLATNKEIDVFLSKYLQNNLKIILQKKQTISYTDLLNQIQKLIPNTLLIPNESTFTYDNKLVKISIKKITNNFNNSQNENYKADDEFEVDSTYNNQPMQKFDYKIKEQKESFHFSYNYLWIILAIIFILSISGLFIYYRHSKKYKLFVFKRNNIKRK